MNLFQRFFKMEEKEPHSLIDDLEFDESEKQLIKEFSRLKAGKRIRRVMVWGDSGQVQYYPLLKYSIIYDPDLNVRMAALKRIHLFKTHPDAISMLNDLNKKAEIRTLEPYYSMALSKIGIISLKEFEERINKLGK
jgi:hypothetical protein